ncbi:hypothetical protein ABBQ32_005208 [Trebouxia sp. C0010 RCD-2024]
MATVNIVHTARTAILHNVHHFDSKSCLQFKQSGHAWVTPAARTYAMPAAVVLSVLAVTSLVFNYCMYTQPWTGLAVESPTHGCVPCQEVSYCFLLCTCLEHHRWLSIDHTLQMSWLTTNPRGGVTLAYYQPQSLIRVSGCVLAG